MNIKKAATVLSVLFVLILIGIYYISSGPQQAATIRKIPKVTPRIDQPAVTVKLELTGKPPGKPGETGNLAVTLTAYVDVPEVLLKLSAMGEAVALFPPGFKETAAPISPAIKGLQPGRQFEQRLSNLKAEHSYTLDIPLKIVAPGRGFIWGKITSPPKTGTFRVDHASALYFFVTKEEVFASHHSFLDLEAQKLTRDLTRKGLVKAEIAKQVARLKRRGAYIDKKMLPGRAAQPPSPLKSPHNSVTVQGQVRFTASNGVTQPVHFARVQVWDEEDGPEDELVATTSTDAEGNYTVTVDDLDGDGTGRDLYVVVRAEGDTVRVEDHGSDEEIATGDVWEIDSLPAAADVADESTLEINLTATNDDAHPNNVAFEVYEAVNYVSRYLPDLGEPLPPRVRVRMPCPEGFSSCWDSEIHLEESAIHDWDFIFHEYAHFLQHHYGTADHPGGSHSTWADMCRTRGKDEGLRIAWAEGWATFFAIMAQREMNLAALGIPKVGDLRIAVTSIVDFDLETENGLGISSEGNEGSVQRALWDLYDSVNDAGDMDVSLGARELWDLVKNHRPYTFSAFWNALIDGCTEAEKAAFGAILAQHQLAPAPSEPAEGTTYSGGAVPTFRWSGNMECATSGNARYSLRFYNDTFTSLIWASPWQSETTFTPTEAQRNLIFAAPEGPLRWVVTGRDETDPATGIYYGQAQTLNDAFAVPDRNPVDLVLCLDLSNSMMTLVPGSETPLIKLDLLKQAVEVFIRTWTMHAIAGDRIGVVYFSTDTSTVPGAPPMLMAVADKADDIISDVRGKTVGVCTGIGGALQVAYNSFEPASPNKKVIILFTDGIQSVNPFVAEEGSPARLKIRTLPVDGTLPFDGVWCDRGTARPPDESAIVPDGQFLDEHNVQVHTIGVGVDGDSFVDLINRIASETRGLHLFTSTPDAELDIFYTNDLVNSLKTATLEVVKTVQGTLAPGEYQAPGIPVNEAARALTLVLSWKGKLARDALTMQISAPDGSSVSPTKISQGEFYTIVNVPLPPVAKGRTIGHAGNWVVRLSSQIKDAAVKYQFSAIVDEPCFHYRFEFPGKDYGTGDHILLTATLTQKGKPLGSSDGVSVQVSRPQKSLANLLSEWLPEVNKATIAAYQKSCPADCQNVPGYAGLMALSANPQFVAQSRGKITETVRLYDDGLAVHGDRQAGDGIYANILRATQTPGNYRFKLDILTPSRCGRVARSEVCATLVQIHKFDPKRSRLQVGPVSETAQEITYLIKLKPADQYGNLLGPGKAAGIKLFYTAGISVDTLKDNGDGSYQQLLKINRGANPGITIQINGKPFIHASLLTLAPGTVSGLDKRRQSLR